MFFRISATLPVDFMPLTEDEKEKLRKSQIPLSVDEVKKMPSPRYIKSHLPLSLLPPSLLNTSKVDLHQTAD